MADTQQKEAQNVDASFSQPLSQPAHSLPYETVLSELSTEADEGLSAAEAKKRLEEHGPNEIEGGEGVSFAKIVIKQIANAMMLVSNLASYPFRFVCPRLIVGRS